MNVACNKCGQTGMFINPGVPCLRRFADGTKVCLGTMVEITGKSKPSSQRQALNRERRKAEGICRQCSEPLASNSIAFCERHLEEHRENARQRYKNKNDRT